MNKSLEFFYKIWIIYVYCIFSFDSFFFLSHSIKEACILLNLKVGSAILLKQVLEVAIDHGTANGDPNAAVTDPKAALYEIGVFKLTPDKSLQIISLRTNLSLG